MRWIENEVHNSNLRSIGIFTGINTHNNNNKKCLIVFVFFINIDLLLVATLKKSVWHIYTRCIYTYGRFISFRTCRFDCTLLLYHLYVCVCVLIYLYFGAFLYMPLVYHIHLSIHSSIHLSIYSHLDRLRQKCEHFRIIRWRDYQLCVWWLCNMM